MCPFLREKLWETSLEKFSLKFRVGSILFRIPEIFTTHTHKIMCCYVPVPSIQSASELNQNIFRIKLTFSTDSERFQNSFCIDSEISLNQSEIQNLCPLNFSESEEKSECNSKLVLNQKRIQNAFLN